MIAEPLPPKGHVLSPADLAERWGVSPETLRKWRRVGTGPIFAKFGSVVRYLESDVIAFETRSRKITA